jgi:hypothetical protein
MRIRKNGVKVAAAASAGLVLGLVAQATAHANDAAIDACEALGPGVVARARIVSANAVAAGRFVPTETGAGGDVRQRAATLPGF